MQKQKYPPICVSGMGCVCAAGTKCHELLQNESTLSDQNILHKQAMPYPFFAAPEVAFNSNRLSSARDTLNLAAFAAKQALEQAKVIDNKQYLQNCGVILGTTAGSALHFLEDYAAGRSLDAEKLQTSPLPQGIADYFDSNISLGIATMYNLQGPTLTIANACTSGADAIGMAMDMLMQDQCGMVLCGGADALSLVPHTGFARLMIYSNELCRPFDANRKGLNLGEGAGALVLEKTEHALARGVKPLGFIAGYGAFADAHHFTAPHPQARGLHAAVNTALKQAHIGKDQLAFINAHGTATPENDKVEGKYFKQYLTDIPVWATKSITGHTLGAAGAVEAILCLLALQNKILPKTRNFEQVDQEIGITPNLEPLKLQKNYALSTSLGFGGSNAALVLKGIDDE